MTDPNLNELTSKVVAAQSRYWIKRDWAEYLRRNAHAEQCKYIAKFSPCQWQRYLHTLDEYGFEVKKKEGV